MRKGGFKKMLGGTLKWGKNRNDFFSGITLDAKKNVNKKRLQNRGGRTVKQKRRRRDEYIKMGVRKLGDAN